MNERHDSNLWRSAFCKTMALAVLGLSAICLTACEQEVISERNSSLGSQMGQLSKGGWNVAGSGNQSSRSQDPLNDPNVRVIKPADFSNLQFHMSPQGNDAQATTQAQQSVQQPGNPLFVPVQRTPGR